MDCSAAFGEENFISSKIQSANSFVAAYQTQINQLALLGRGS